MLRIYIANLGKYNEGELVGAWIDLPAYEKDLEQLYIDIKVAHRNESGKFVPYYEENDVIYEEVAIHDYECNLDGIKISEYSDIDKLNEIAEILEEFDADETDIIEAIIDNGEDIQTAIEKVKDNEYIFYSGCSTMGEVAERYCNDCGILDSIPDDLRYYFDFEAYGRDMEIEGNFVQTAFGYAQIL